MKRVITLLLAIMWSVLLVACSSTPQPDNDDTQPNSPPVSYDIADEMSAEEKFAVISKECVGFLQVTLNPSFELYVTWDNTINEMRTVSVRPINEDAKALFANISVAGLTLYDSLFTICDAARDSGYLTAANTLTVNYYGQVQQYDTEVIIGNILKGYQQEKGISFTYDVLCTESTSAPGSPGGQTQTTPGTQDKPELDASLYDTVEYDAAGNIVKTVLINREDNCIETCTYDADGALLCFVFEDINHGQTREEYYANRQLVKVASFHDGGSTVQTFDSSGNMSCEITEDTQSGAHSETRWTYYDDGTAASCTVKLTNSYYAQGYYKEEQYYRGGAVAMTYEVSQYGDNKFYYDAAGNTTRYEGKDSSGNRVETVYHADGSYVSKIYEPNGHVRVENWSADGTLTVS